MQSRALLRIFNSPEKMRAEARDYMREEEEFMDFVLTRLNLPFQTVYP
jgi:hypothetical protein